jgi:hypothetical protein
MKNNTGRFLAAAACLIVLLLMNAPPATSGAMTEITDLISHAEHYDRQMVVVVGRVSKLQAATTRQGQPGYGFLLNAEGGSSVKVVGLGRAEVQEGDQVVVEGVFNRLRQVGRSIVYNEIKASLIRSVSRLNPDLVG